VDGLGQSPAKARINQFVAPPANDGTTSCSTGINFDSTTATPGGQWGRSSGPNLAAPVFRQESGFNSFVSLGQHYAQSMEIVDSSTGTCTFYGSPNPNRSGMTVELSM